MLLEASLFVVLCDGRPSKLTRSRSGNQRKKEGRKVGRKEGKEGEREKRKKIERKICLSELDFSPFPVLIQSRKNGKNLYVCQSSFVLAFLHVFGLIRQDPEQIPPPKCIRY